VLDLAMGFTGCMPDLGWTDRASSLRAHEAFLTTGDRPTSVRSVIADSWIRSLAAGVAAEGQAAPITLDRELLTERRAAHPLSRVFPLLYDVLGRAAEDCDSIMAVADACGQLLWVCGRPSVLRAAESINFVEGARWDEDHAGTNAPGTALRLDSPVTVRAEEHFARSVQRWSCAAAPVHDPETHAILGILDITGSADVASPQTIAMVRAAARMAESELARLCLLERSHRLSHPSAITGPSELLRLDGLGRPDCLARIGDRLLRLSPRHSEIAVILSRHPDGLSGDQLAIELYEGDMMSSTLRAELVRLRTLLGRNVLGSRPYRLLSNVESDWSQVSAALAVGDVGEAVRQYRGPLLPHSEAPGVRRYRQQLQRELRAAVLGSAKPDLMVAWTRSRWGAEDLPMWRAQLASLPGDSPLYLLALAETARLDAEFGS
jgi:hypothetical protein